VTHFGSRSERALLTQTADDVVRRLIVGKQEIKTEVPNHPYVISRVKGQR